MVFGCAFSGLAQALVFSEAFGGFAAISPPAMRRYIRRVCSSFFAEGDSRFRPAQMSEPKAIALYLIEERLIHAFGRRAKRANLKRSGSNSK
jgi:hypothetical protein